MLETRNLCKSYKPKRGVPVKALDDISLKFPEKGMVFLLGKSGSGKSTMLNLLGGLDKYDSGEIIIKGVSSKDFKQQYFDSYRNTYVGFIFQEYNILEEFSVGANIALAIELQGRKATDEEVNNILKEVDLEGYGNRKPNELSGGQKQRVAIARALIKNPEIIMADEPTGALDSNTGKQVFDTLKKLSKNKLVIIVSHDREFSEQYADRIIELADGKVISDVEVLAGADLNNSFEDVSEDISYSGNTIEIKQGYQITEQDRIAINEYLEKINSGNVTLTVKGKKKGVRSFVNTDQSKIVSQDGSTFKLIKSKLPLKSAFKIGASGLKYKKVKLVFTILLSCVAFALFGLADTFGAYNHNKTLTKSIKDTGINYVSYVEERKESLMNYEYWYSYGTTISKEEMEKISKDTGVEFTGVYDRQGMMSFYENFNEEAEFTETNVNIYTSYFNGFAEVDADKLEAMGYEILAGKLPDGNKNEILISEYVYKTFEIGGYCEASDKMDDEEDSKKYTTITKYEDLVGKTLTLNEQEFVITGIVDTKVDLDRYIGLTEENHGMTTANQIINYALTMELDYIINYSLSSVAMVGTGYVDRIIEISPPSATILADLYGMNLYENGSYMGGLYFSEIASIDEVDMSKVDIMWFDGEKTSLKDKEIIVSSDCVDIYDENTYERVDFSTIKNKNFELEYYDNDVEDYVLEGGYKVVGIIDTLNGEQEAWSSTIVTNSNFYEFAMLGHERGEYSYIVGSMPEDSSDIKKIVEYTNKNNGEIRYELQNAVTFELETIHDILKVLSKVFFWIGFGFAIFASLMLANFIATSISYKKQEIGILRAIGSRSNDVFAIFFSESFIIAMVNFIISTILVAVATVLINGIIRYGAGVLVTVLTFSFRQVILILFISVGIAAISSFIPVMKIASKKPIDAIRNR